MLGLELTSETMLCLGIMFILSGIFFFYMKKQITHLEDAQMEQAKLLQHIIANISTIQPNMTGNIGVNMDTDLGASIGENNEEYHQGNLIDVSDGEENSDSEENDDSGSEGSFESEEDSDDEDENEIEEEDLVNSSMAQVNIDKNTLREFSVMPSQEMDLNAIDEDSIVEIPNTVKVVNMNTGKEASNEPEEVELELESLTSTNLDDDDSLTINSSVSGANLAKTSLKALKVGDLRKMVLEKGLHDKPKTLKKSELITLLN